MIVKMIKIANINKLPLNTIYINSCVHFGFQLIPLTAVLYSHIDKTLFIVKKTMPIWSTWCYDLIIALKNSHKQSSLIVVSGFTSSAAFYNTTTVTLRCDHLDFNRSNTPMRIKEQGRNDHGSCSKNNTCTSSCKCMHD